MSAVVVGVAVYARALAGFAAPGADEQLEARLDIDASKAGAGAEVLHRRIEERANVVLRHAKVLPGDGDDPALVIIVRAVEGDEPGFAATFELRGADGSLLGEPVEIECSLCTETELVARVEAELEPMVDALREVGPKPSGEAEAPPPAVTPAEPQHEQRPGPGSPRGAGMLAGGATLLVVGSAALGAGVGLAIAEPRVDEDNPLDLITTRPVGYALLAGGIVTATTGAILTALAVKQRRQARWSLTPYALGWKF